MSNPGDKSVGEVVEDAQEVTEEFGLRHVSPPTSDLEHDSGDPTIQQNKAASGIASHPLQDIVPDAVVEQKPLSPNPKLQRSPASSAIPKKSGACGIRGTKSPNKSSADSLEFSKSTGARPKSLFNQKPFTHLPPFKKTPSPKTKSKTQSSQADDPRPDLAEHLHRSSQHLDRQELDEKFKDGQYQHLLKLADLEHKQFDEQRKTVAGFEQEIKRLGLHQNPLLPNRQISDLRQPDELLQSPHNPDLQSGMATDGLVEEFQSLDMEREHSVEPPMEPEAQNEPESQTDPGQERLGEQAQYVRKLCLDFQDYKRTVNNRQKGLEQSLNQIMPQMNEIMKDAQKLSSKIETTRNQDVETAKALRNQNDKLRYLVVKTAGTITQIQRQFERFKPDILDYTILTTEGNVGIDQRLSKLLKVLCNVREGSEDSVKKVITDSFDKDTKDD